jgi:hypothetical protein
MPIRRLAKLDRSASSRYPGGVVLTYQDALADLRKAVDYWRNEHEVWLKKPPADRNPATLTRMMLRMQVLEGVYEQMKARWERENSNG